MTGRGVPQPSVDSLKPRFPGSPPQPAANIKASPRPVSSPRDGVSPVDPRDESPVAPVWLRAYCVCCDPGAPRPFSPRSVELRRSTLRRRPWAPSPGRKSRARFRVYLMEPEPFARGTDGSSLEAGRSGSTLADGLFLEWWRRHVAIADRASFSEQ